MNRVAEHGGAPRALPEWTRPRRVSVTAFAAALTATLFAVTAPAEEHLLRGGNGPGPAANGPGPGCNLIPPLASTGTKVDISQFPPPDSLTDPELAGPVQLLRPRRHPQRNDHAAAFQGRGEDAVWSEARVVCHSRCRQPS